MKILIVGTCAFETKEILHETIAVLKELGISRLRASLWKPRTQPGWDGVGFGYLPTLLDTAKKHGMEPATEIGSAEHARLVVDVLHKKKHPPNLIVWLGSRNQNHSEQRSIGKILSESPFITLMCKNQMWEDERHWLGICEHVLSGGFPKERLWLCHRGFCPGKHTPNPNKFRNIPDFEMAMKVKEQTGLPMILDPSHIGGSPENVVLVFQHSFDYDFDGYLIEMHVAPEKAITDAKQQLTPLQLKALIEMLDQSYPEKRIKEAFDVESS